MIINSGYFSNTNTPSPSPSPNPTVSPDNWASPSPTGTSDVSASSGSGTPFVFQTNLVTGASSIKFNVSFTTAVQMVNDYTFSVKNTGTTTMMMRIEGIISNQSALYIINGAQQKAWNYSNGKWTDLSPAFSAQYDLWSETWREYCDNLSAWLGTDEYSYTDPPTGNNIRLYSITVNPELSDSLFQHSSWDYPNPGSYEKSISINTDNSEEANALSVAENINYSSILGVERFFGYNGTDYYGHETWAKFIDTEVINYYNNRFEILKGQPRSMSFSYAANVYTWNQIGVIYVPENRSLNVLSANGTVLVKSAQFTGPIFGMRYFCRNGSEYQEIQTDQINFNFSTSYVVEMNLKHYEGYGPLYAFMTDVYHITILDEHFEPLFFCLQAKNGIS